MQNGELFLICHITAQLSKYSVPPLFTGFNLVARFGATAGKVQVDILIQRISPQTPATETQEKTLTQMATPEPSSSLLFDEVNNQVI